MKLNMQLGDTGTRFNYQYTKFLLSKDKTDKYYTRGALAKEPLIRHWGRMEGRDEILPEKGSCK